MPEQSTDLNIFSSKNNRGEEPLKEEVRINGV